VPLQGLLVEELLEPGQLSIDHLVSILNEAGLLEPR